MRKKYEKLKDQYPEYISLDQLCQICRIAKRSARYLVEHEIIPSIDTGKKTWRYKISIDDVITYFRLPIRYNNDKGGKPHRINIESGFLRNSRSCFCSFPGKNSNEIRTPESEV